MIRVIVADDEQKVSQLICTLIDWPSLDMEVVGVAHDGLKALELIEQMQPDLVITDIRMPGRDGLELVRLARALNSNLEFIIISGYRHFEYARTAMQHGVSDYLLKPINKEELQSTLEKMRWKHMHRTRQLTDEEELKHRLQSDLYRLRAGLLELLFQQERASAYTWEISSLNQDFHYQFQPGIFQVVVVKISGQPTALLSGGMNLLKEKCAEAMQELLGPKCHDLGLFPHLSSVVAVCNYPEDKQDDLHKQLRVLLDELRLQKSLFPDVVFTVALGSEEAQADKLPLSYRQAQANVQQRLVAGSREILEGEIPPSQNNADMLLAKVLPTIESGLELLDESTVRQGVSLLSEELQQEPLSGGELLHLVEELYSHFLLLAKRLQLQLADGENAYDKFCRQADLCSSAGELLEHLSHSLSAALLSAAAERKNEDARPIRAAKQYIQTHYMRPITLEEVSRHAGFNASYFSSLFKKETGQNFQEYVSEVRMSKAKELLRESHMSIAQICEAVGYLDQKHFTKSFKKATGIKPGEYRKLYS